MIEEPLVTCWHAGGSCSRCLKASRTAEMILDYVINAVDPQYHEYFLLHRLYIIYCPGRRERVVTIPEVLVNGDFSQLSALTVAVVKLTVPVPR